MAARGIAPGSQRVHFGQLLGMSDHLTLTLGRAGYRYGAVARETTCTCMGSRLDCTAMHQGPRRHGTERAAAFGAVSLAVPQRDLHACLPRSAYKYVPYGLVEQVMPYLLRRATENADMLKVSSMSMRRHHSTTSQV